MENWRIKIASLPHSDRIIFSEFRKDNYAVEHFFDILILPSTSPDPLPTVVLESMGCGRAVIGYAHGGVTEMVKDEYNGLLVDPLNKIALQKSVKSCISKKTYKRFGINSRRRLVEKFSLNMFINNFVNLYNKE